MRLPRLMTWLVATVLGAVLLATAGARAQADDATSEPAPAAAAAGESFGGTFFFSRRLLG